MAETPYELLGVAKTADADTIRKAYRKLARKHHPDVNPGDARSEDSFKKIASAYEVLSDPKRRAAYDEFGDAALAGGFDADKARAFQQWQDTQQQRSTRFDDGPVEFDFSELFGRARGPARGHDLRASVQMDLHQAVAGAEVSLDLPGQGVVRVRIPPGADTGSIIRLAGKGAPGARGGPPGDLVIETEVRPHPVFRRDGLDLSLTLPVTLDEIYNGASIEVPTFAGPVMLKVPPRSQSGARLRLRGKGIQRKDTSGDLFAVLDVRMPDRADDALAAALRASTADYSAPVRQELKAMTTTRFTYQHLIELVGGDHELIARLIEEGEIERRDDDVAVVDLDRVLITRTLVRELEIDWPGVEVILRLVEELRAARRRIAELEAAGPPR